MQDRKLFKWKRVAIDFDGTLVEQVYDTPLQTTDAYFEKNIPIPAKEGAAETTAWLREKGFEILIFTCRPDWQRKYIESILDNANISYDYILFYTKPLVDLYIDDKGFRFSDWGATKQWIEERLDAPMKQVSAIGMEPQNDFEDLLRKERINVLLHENEGMVLDVGCGSGRLWQLAPPEKLPTKILAVEPNNELRARAISTQRIFLVLRSGEHYEIDKFDLVTMFGVLEHVDDPRALLDEYSGAKEIAITVPNANSFHRKVGKFAGMIGSVDELGPQDIEVGHKRVFTYAKFSKLINEFATEHRYRINKMGTLGFKMVSGAEMMQFADRWDAINKAAMASSIIGNHCTGGAEIYCRLEKI